MAIRLLKISIEEYQKIVGYVEEDLKELEANKRNDDMYEIKHLRLKTLLNKINNIIKKETEKLQKDLDDTHQAKTRKKQWECDECGLTSIEMVKKCSKCGKADGNIHLALLLEEDSEEVE